MIIIRIWDDWLDWLVDISLSLAHNRVGETLLFFPTIRLSIPCITSFTPFPPSPSLATQHSTNIAPKREAILRPSSSFTTLKCYYSLEITQKIINSRSYLYLSKSVLFPNKIICRSRPHWVDILGHSPILSSIFSANL